MRAAAWVAVGACAAAAAAIIAACSNGSPPAGTSMDATAQGLDGSPEGSPAADADAGASPGTDAHDAHDAHDATVDGWVLTWSDEFDQPDGSAVDPAKWNQLDAAATSNKELEYYTGGTANAVVENGMLVITAKTEGASQYTCSYGPCLYTSARIHTLGKFAQQYGRFEARIQIPRGQGLWPAWWMEGSDKPTVGWPACGEIDIMENIGRTPSTDYGSMHGPGDAGAYNLTGNISLPDGGALADDFHVYAVEWDQTAVHFFLDQAEFETRVPSDLPPGQPWEFDKPFFLILNVAVGGNWPGNPNASTQFPQTMLVDYVRVYAKAR